MFLKRSDIRNMCSVPKNIRFFVPAWDTRLSSSAGAQRIRRLEIHKAQQLDGKNLSDL